MNSSENWNPGENSSSARIRKLFQNRWKSSKDVRRFGNPIRITKRLTDNRKRGLKMMLDIKNHKWPLTAICEERTWSRVTLILWSISVRDNRIFLFVRVRWSAWISFQEKGPPCSWELAVRGIISGKRRTTQRAVPLLRLCRRRGSRWCWEPAPKYWTGRWQSSR